VPASPRDPRHRRPDVLPRSSAAALSRHLRRARPSRATTIAFALRSTTASCARSISRSCSTGRSASRSVIRTTSGRRASMKRRAPWSCHTDWTRRLSFSTATMSHRLAPQRPLEASDLASQLVGLGALGLLLGRELPVPARVAHRSSRSLERPSSDASRTEPRRLRRLAPTQNHLTEPSTRSRGPRQYIAQAGDRVSPPESAVLRRSWRSGCRAG
jgi:hypothetical protein